MIALRKPSIDVGAFQPTPVADEMEFLDTLDPVRLRSPKIHQVAEAWQGMRPAPHLLPGRQHFDPSAVGRLLPQVMTLDLLRADGELRAMRYRLIGSMIRDAYGEDTTGKLAETFPRHFRLAAESGKPVWRFGPPAQTILKGRVTAIENLILPLASDGTTVDVLVLLSVFFDQSGREFRPFRSRVRLA
ncbi:MAG: PAS domain-containing protein [Rhodospirillaceae bacterium]|nr:PAS domain-containing protein [Rhodospirillaceae bacterium]